jgi:hypothetical protein
MSLRLAALAGIGLAGLVLLAGLLWYRAEAIAARADAARHLAERDAALAANRRLAEQAEIDGRTVLGLSRELATIYARLAAEAADLAELERTDDAVRDYLDTPVPDALRLRLGR